MRERRGRKNAISSPHSFLFLLSVSRRRATDGGGEFAKLDDALRRREGERIFRGHRPPDRGGMGGPLSSFAWRASLPPSLPPPSLLLILNAIGSVSALPFEDGRGFSPTCANPILLLLPHTVANPLCMRGGGGRGRSGGEAFENCRDYLANGERGGFFVQSWKGNGGRGRCVRKDRRGKEQEV